MQYGELQSNRIVNKYHVCNQVPYVDVRGQKDNNTAQHRAWFLREHASIGFLLRFSPPPHLKTYTNFEAYDSNGDSQWTHAACENLNLKSIEFLSFAKNKQSIR